MQQRMKARRRKRDYGEILRQFIGWIIGTIIGAVGTLILSWWVDMQISGTAALLSVLTVGAVMVLTLTGLFSFIVLERLTLENLYAIRDISDDLAHSVFGAKYAFIGDKIVVGQESNGAVYTKLAELVKRAESCIQILSNASISDENYRDRDTKNARLSYYRELESIILDRAKQGAFTYERILQLRQTRSGKSLECIFGETLQRHYQEILSNTQLPPGNLRNKTRLVDTSRLTGFLIIDHKILVIVVGGIDDQKSPCHMGLIIFEALNTNSSQIITSYMNYFTSLMDSNMSDEIPNWILRDNKELRFRDDAQSETHV